MSIWNFLTPGQVVAGPRLVTADGFIHSQPPPHVPPLPERYAPQGDEPCYPPTARAAWKSQMSRAVRKRPGEPA